MKHNKKKILKINSELMMVLMQLGCKDINTSLHMQNDECTIILRGRYCPTKKNQLERIGELLKCKRSPELEESYWSIAGIADVDQGSEIYVVASMLDSCNVLYDDEFIEITAYRKV